MQPCHGEQAGPHHVLGAGAFEVVTNVLPPELHFVLTLGEACSFNNKCVDMKQSLRNLLGEPEAECANVGANN